MQDENLDSKPKSKSKEQKRAEVWRDVTHRLASAVGIVRSAEGQFGKMSKDSRELMGEGISRLLDLITDCAHQQTVAEREAKK